MKTCLFLGLMLLITSTSQADTLMNIPTGSRLAAITDIIFPANESVSSN